MTSQATEANGHFPPSCIEPLPVPSSITTCEQGFLYIGGGGGREGSSDIYEVKDLHGGVFQSFLTDGKKRC